MIKNLKISPRAECLPVGNDTDIDGYLDLGVSGGIHRKAKSSGHGHPTITSHCTVKPLDTRQAMWTKEIQSLIRNHLSLTHRLLSSHTVLCSSWRESSRGALTAFPPNMTHPDLRLHFCNVTVDWLNIKPGPHVGVSCRRSITLTWTPTHRLCVSSARSIPHCSTCLETKTNKSFACSQPTDGKVWFNAGNYLKNDFGSKKSKLGSLCLIEKACKEIWEF